jgi:hypothetical protein
MSTSASVNEQYREAVDDAVALLRQMVQRRRARESHPPDQYADDKAADTGKVSAAKGAR